MYAIRSYYAPLHMEKKLRMSPEQVHEQAKLAVRFARQFTEQTEPAHDVVGRPGDEVAIAGAPARILLQRALDNAIGMMTEPRPVWNAARMPASYNFV